ncbi:MAG: fluoride efflux transporter CrcB [Candidatus Neomarinimicrobiota bacterium]|jgi:CrcB protein
MSKYLFIALGGALGAVLRFFLSTCLNSASNTQFPWGTLGVNLIGSFILAFFIALSGGEQNSWYFFLAVGLLGAFTTFSTFSVETFSLIQTAGIWMGLLNMFANLAGGLSLAIGGYYLGSMLK